MGVIGYGPGKEALAGVHVFAKRAGFRKVGRRFRLATEEGHLLVLRGEEGMPYQGYREASWSLRVCYRPWVDINREIWNKDPVTDPWKIDADKDDAFAFGAKPRPNPGGERRRQLLGYEPGKPADIADFVEHVRWWFEDVALPMAYDWLANPETILAHCNLRRAFYDLHPQTDIHITATELPLAALLAAEVGNRERALSSVAEWLDCEEDFLEYRRQYVPVLRKALAERGIELPD